MILYHSPGSCSEGLTLLLHLSHLPHEICEVLLAKAEHLSPEFLHLNPKGKIPALVLPGVR